MEPNSQNDNLEDLFRRSFGPEGNGAEGEGWNSPPTEMWGNIRAGIAPAPVPFWQSSRPWKWGSLVASLLLIWLSVQLFSYRSTIDTLTEKVARHDLLMDDLHAELHTQQESKHLPIPAGPNHTESGQEAVSSVPAQIDKSPIVHIYTQPSTISKSEIYVPVERDTKAGLQTETQDSKTEPSGISIQSRESSTSLPELFLMNNRNNRELLAGEVMVPTRIDKLASLASHISVTGKGNNGFYLGLTAAPIWITQIRKGGSPPSNPPKIQSRTGWSAGVKIGKRIGGNWSLETGLLFTNHITNSVQEHKIKFSRNEESSNPEGGYESKYRINLSAGSEEIDTDVTFTRPESVQPEEGERIGLDFQITEVTNYLDVPIVGRHAFKAGRLNLAFRMGVLNRFKFSNAFSLNKVNIGSEKFQPSRVKSQGAHGRRRRVSTNLKTYTLHAVGGLGATYQLSNAWQVSLEPSVVRSITPIGTAGPNERITLGQESFSLNTSLEYRF